MWDKLSLAEELRIAGFSQIRECKFNDSADQMFHLVEIRAGLMLQFALNAENSVD